MSEDRSAVERLTLERAVERVRAAAMEMRGSDDLRRVVAVLCAEMRDLAVRVEATSIQFVDEEAGTVTTYVAVPRPASLSERPDAREEDRGVASSTRAPRPLAAADARSDLSPWRNQRAETYTSLAAGETEEEFQRFMLGALGVRLEDAGEDVIESWRGDWAVTNVPFRFGQVGYRERTHHPEHDVLVAELARGLELGFARFRDMQQLEQQKRELEVEQQLERLRTKIAAMAASDDLGDLVKALGEGISQFGVSPDAFGILIVDEASRTVIQHGPRGQYEPVNLGVFGALEPWEERWRGWRRRTVAPGNEGSPAADEPFERTWSVELTRKQVQSMADAGHLEPVEVGAEWIQERRVIDVFFEHGSVALNKPGSEPFTHEQRRLLERFTDVFALGYRRHLDLQGAEQRARDADRSRAHQHVRSVVSSMQTADDIGDVVVVLRNELRGLDIAVDQVGINIADEETKTIRTSWSSIVGKSDEGGVTHGGRQSPSASNARLLEIWKSGEPWNRARSETNPEDLGWVVDVPFDFGTIAMNCGQTNGDVPAFTDEDVETLRGFAEVISLGYTRFRDFEQLETQNRGLIVDRAVEHVRAEATAMRESADIGKVIAALYEGWRDTGLEFQFGCLNIVDTEAGLYHTYILAPPLDLDETVARRLLIEADIVPGLNLYRSPDVDLEFARQRGWAQPDLAPALWEAPETFPDDLVVLWHRNGPRRKGHDK